MITPRRWLTLLSIFTVAVIALALRLRAVAMLPIDYDEDDYLLAAQHYAAAINAGDWAEIMNYSYNYEHPPLTKLLYGLAIAPLPPSPEIPDLPTSAPPARTLPRPHFDVARLVAAAEGTLEVLALALFNPLAALFLAVDTWQIKYTSQIMLEPLPALTSALAVLFYLKSNRRWNVWLILSAVALGLTAAGKYMYCVAGIAIVAHWLWQTYPADEPRTAGRLGRWMWPVVAWGLIVVAAFFAADPYLWPDPLGRLTQSVLYHGNYALNSTEVQQANYPPWQPLVWLSGPVPWHPGVFVVSIDLFISLLALLGMRRLWRKQPVFVIWLGVAIGFLLVWPTKWPQYILCLTVPLCVAASEGFSQWLWEPVVGWVRGWNAPRPQTDGAEAAASRRDGRRAVPWLLPGLVVLAVITVFPLIFQGAMALTDFNAMSIRDGMTGGVWREVARGLTGQAAPATVDVFGRGPNTPKVVHYAGPGVLWQLFGGFGADVLWFDVMWTVLSVGLQSALGVGLALMLNRRGVRFAGWWRAVFILPWAVPEFVGALVWLMIFDPANGFVSQTAPGGASLPSYFNNPTMALGVLLIASTWMGFPFIMLAATAGLKLAPPEVYDAAALDGAGGWRQFRFVTWPLLLPLLAPALIIRSIFAFNQFYLFWVMQSPFPLVTFSTVSYIFFSGYGGGRFAVSAAINIFTVVVLMALIAVFNRWSRAAEGVTYA